MKAVLTPRHVFTVYTVVVINCLVGCKKESAVEPVPTTPVVRLISPTSSSILQDSVVVVEVEATDDKGVVKVEVYIDNQIPQGGTLLVAPYKYTWNISSYLDSSSHTLFAKAYDADGNVSTSSVLTLVLFKFAPSNLTAMVVPDTFVLLAWKDNSRKEDGFLIERSTDGVSFLLVDSVGANVTAKSVPGVYIANTPYAFRVRAKSANSFSAYSNIATVAFAFPAPSGLTVSSLTSTSVNLQWTDNSTFETGFLIERSTDGINFTLIDSVGANVTTKSVGGVYIANTTYSFRVRAKSAYNVSPYSNVSANFVRDASMVTVAGGTFQMGSTADAFAAPVHSVTLSTFYIDKTEITHEKWTDVRGWGLTHGYTDLVAGINGYTGTGTNNPVTQVSWYDVLKWCNARSEKDGLTPVYYTNNTLATVYRTGELDLASDAVKWTANGYRLPTEAEWEFAARGGTKSQGYTYSGSNIVDDVAWYGVNSGNNTHPVSIKGANELGIYDMSGNVWEWCWDWRGAYSSNAQTDPKGPTSGSYRVLRGASFYYDATLCRVTNRDGYLSPQLRNGTGVGFRCVQE